MLKNVAEKLLKNRLLWYAPLILILPMLWNVFHLKRSLYPSFEAKRVFCYADSSEVNGKSSIISFDVGSDYISLKSVLKEGYSYPYAGFQIDYATDSTWLDISSYDNLTLNIKADSISKVILYIKTFVENYTELSTPTTHRFLEKEIDVTPIDTRLIIPISKFITSQWWLEDNAIDESRIGEPNLSRVTNIAISSGNITQLNRPFTITVSNIFVTKNILTVVLPYLMAFSIYYLVLLFFFLLLRSGKTVIIPYKKIELSDSLDEDASKIVEYISKNYNVKGITVSKLSEEIGIPTSKIPAILKKKFSMTFKQYLNSIRLAEVKRLLLETDRQVAEIAYQVGYKNVTHFHRIFKEIEKVSPNEFRKKFSSDENSG